MAQLPDLSLGTRPTSKPNLEVVRPITQTGFENIPAQAYGNIANSVNQLGDALFRAKDRNDTLLAEDAYNRLLQKKAELEFGDDGYAMVKGSDAMKADFRTSFAERFDAAANDIAESLGDANQKAMFKRRADLAKGNFQEGVLRHSASESMAFANQTKQARVELSLQTIAMDPSTIQPEMLSAFQVIKLAGEQNGTPDEVLAVEKQAYVDSVFGQIIASALVNGNADLANSYFQEGKDGITVGNEKVSMSDAARIKILPHLKQTTTAIQAMSIADQAFAQFPQSDINSPVRLYEMDAWVRKTYKDDPAAMLAARQEITSRTQLINAQQAEQKANVQSAVDKAFWVDKKSLAEIQTMPEWIQMDGTQQAAIVKMIGDYGYTSTQRDQAERNRAENDLQWEGWQSTVDLMNRPADLAAMTPEQIQAMAPEIGRANASSLLTRRAQIGTDIVGAKIDATNFNIIAGSAGIKTSGAKMQPDDWRRIGQLHNAVDHALQQETKVKGRDLTTEEKRGVMQSVIDHSVLMDEWFSDTRKPAAMVLPEEIENAYIPAPDVPEGFANETINYLRSIGRIPEDMSNAAAMVEFGDTIGHAYGARQVPGVTRAQIETILRDK